MKRLMIPVTIAGVLAVIAGCGGGRNDGQERGEATRTTVVGTATMASSTAEESDLETALSLARKSECVRRERATERILAEAEGDIGVDQIGGIELFGEGGTFEWTGVFAFDVPYTFASGSTARTHSMLYANHWRVFAAAQHFREIPSRFTLARAASSAEVTADPTEVFAEWDGTQLVFHEEDQTTSTEFPWQQLVPSPLDELVLTREARVEAWERLGAEIGELEAVTPRRDRGSLGLEELAPRLDEIDALLCVLLATEFEVAEELLEMHVDDSQWLESHYFKVFNRELAAQSALLATEYFRIIVDHYSQPEIDWLRAGGVDVSQDPFDGVSSTSEFVFLWGWGATFHLELFRDLLSEALPLE